MTFTIEFISSLGLSLAELIDMVVHQANHILQLLGQRDALQAQLQQKNQQIAHLEEKLQEIEQRFERLTADLGNPEVIGDRARFSQVAKERAQLEEMYHRGNCPWMIWDPDRSGVTTPAGGALPEPPLSNPSSSPVSMPQVSISRPR